ncbi:MAG: methionine--tRNA ligase [Candidatus Rokuibacteriota bacterium]|nr:MAG: methionine--tRNA ligase [Candidatus Rokubacteria bacterium]
MPGYEPSRQPFYLTTPIYYINARPHLGHAYTTIVADAMCRYRRLAGGDVHFLTGTDEHGDKIAQAAQQAGESPGVLADRNSAAFRAQWDALGITYDDFIRTTEPRHQTVVQAILKTLWDKGDEIYFDKYGGQYCFGCERFYTEKEIVDGKCPDHQTPLTYIEEENYFFRMSKYQDWLRGELEAYPDRVRPERYRNELLGFLREPLEDLCISRPRSRLEWGIPLPFDDRFVTYVWFDALINYVSALGGPGSPRFERFWPHVQHVIGKDILKPHGVYWPCMLKAAGLPVYTHLNVHGYWTLGGGKMSKSVGNVVEALKLADTYGRDAFRYFVLREMPFGLDASFSEEALVARLNADLANDFGNLVSRATTLLESFGGRLRSREVPADEAEHPHDTALRTLFAEAREIVDGAMEDFAFHRALSALWHFIASVNRYVDGEAPWELAKHPGQEGRLRAVLCMLGDVLRCLGIVLDPFVPDAAARVRAGLGETGPPRLEEAVLGRSRRVPSVQKLPGLFPRILDAAREAERAAARKPDTAPAPAPRITIEEFRRLDLRVDEILDAEPVPKSKKLLKLTVRVGEETRTVVAGIAEHYRADTLPGRKVVIVANLEPATLMGVASNGMVLAGSAGETLALVGLDRDLPPGAVVR